MKNCDNCNSEFNPYRPQQKYCDVCKGNSKLYAKDHYKKKATVCPCGALTGSKNIYCSSECKKSYGNVGLVHNGVVGRKSAICVGCGKEFTRPKSYASAMKYCSNKCSHKEQKSIRDKFVMELNDAAVVFHSTWEIRFAACCMRYGIAWRRYDGDDIETPVGNYRPDFIAGKEEHVVEVKGYMNFDSVVKIETAQRLLGNKYLVITEKELIEFEEYGTINGEQFDVIVQPDECKDR